MTQIIRFQIFTIVPRRLVAVTLWACIRETLGSNLYKDAAYPDGSFRGYHQLLHENTGIVSRLGYDRFLPNPFPFIIYQSSYHSTIYSIDTYQRRKINHK
jgi:hypothetical protein